MKKKITITYPYVNFDTVALLINTNKRYLLLEKVLNYRRKKTFMNEEVLLYIYFQTCFDLSYTSWIVIFHISFKIAFRFEV